MVGRVDIDRPSIPGVGNHLLLKDSAILRSKISIPKSDNSKSVGFPKRIRTSAFRSIAVEGAYQRKRGRLQGAGPICRPFFCHCPIFLPPHHLFEPSFSAIHLDAVSIVHPGEGPDASRGGHGLASMLGNLRPSAARLSTLCQFSDRFQPYFPVSFFSGASATACQARKLPSPVQPGWLRLGMPGMPTRSPAKLATTSSRPSPSRSTKRKP